MTQRLREDGGAGRPARAAGLGPRGVRGAAEPSGPGLSAATRPAVPALPRGGLLTSPRDFRGSAQPRLPEFLRRVLSVSRVCLPSRTFPRAGSLRLLPQESGWPALRPLRPPDVLGTSPSLQPPPPPFSRRLPRGARWFGVQSQGGAVSASFQRPVVPELRLRTAYSTDSAGRPQPEPLLQPLPSTPRCHTYVPVEPLESPGFHGDGSTGPTPFQLLFQRPSHPSKNVAAPPLGQ